MLSFLSKLDNNLVNVRTDHFHLLVGFLRYLCISLVLILWNTLEPSDLLAWSAAFYVTMHHYRFNITLHFSSFTLAQRHRVSDVLICNMDWSHNCYSVHLTTAFLASISHFDTISTMSASCFQNDLIQ